MTVDGDTFRGGRVTPDIRQSREMRVLLKGEDRHLPAKLIAMFLVDFKKSYLGPGVTEAFMKWDAVDLLASHSQSAGKSRDPLPVVVLRCPKGMSEFCPFQGDAGCHVARTGGVWSILVESCPKTKEAAWANLLAFSNERRLKGRADPSPWSVTSIPRMRQCYGWLKISPDLDKVDKIVRTFELGKCYMAIVYEFIEETENDLEIAQIIVGAN
ncbi:hypothetical protein M434DRAFT_30418 [Hypoxylon sp. CO27-5]|nr:hypothetical protein M434DRAFT_30418 [Hypoxylon sp. CO27-5]